ncbi:thermonuclease family protein [Sphingomicrobium sp. XHP0239]|uniref:thermonuclease family protein n=1 Tax=Sphingomicrobium maritimum TaxID=3133972 RepID=UPI0031CCCD38
MGKMRPFRTSRPARRRWPIRASWSSLRTIVLLAAVVGLYALSEPAIVSTGTIFEAERERITGPFSRCGRGRLHACVVDGDTIRLGDRRIRMLGIDAPELFEPACSREADLAAAASAELLRQLNRGDVVMIRDRRDGVDRYGRDLRRLVRDDAGGEVDIAGELVAMGLARRWIGYDVGWC